MVADPSLGTRRVEEMAAIQDFDAVSFLEEVHADGAAIHPRTVGREHLLLLLLLLLLCVCRGSVRGRRKTLRGGYKSS